MKNVIYIHVCTINNWESVLNHILSVIFNTHEFINHIDQIKIFMIGTERFEYRHDKISVVHLSHNISLYERPTLYRLYIDSDTDTEFNALYLHTKGISHNNRNPNVTDWTNLMLYWLIEQYPLCLAALEHHDTVGINYKDTPQPHYSGNFWWARSNYIKTLQLDRLCDSHYNAPEFWLLSQNPHHICLHDSNINHYHDPYPRFIYENNS